MRSMIGLLADYSAVSYRFRLRNICRTNKRVGNSTFAIGEIVGTVALEKAFSRAVGWAGNASNVSCSSWREDGPSNYLAYISSKTS